MDLPDLDTEWTQLQLHAWVRQMGIITDPTEIIPQGVKFIEWPQTPPTEAEIAWGRKLSAEYEAGKLKPIAVIRRISNPRRN